MQARPRGGNAQWAPVGGNTHRRPAGGTLNGRRQVATLTGNRASGHHSPRSTDGNIHRNRRVAISTGTGVATPSEPAGSDIGWVGEWQHSEAQQVAILSESASGNTHRRSGQRCSSGSESGNTDRDRRVAILTDSERWQH